MCDIRGSKGGSPLGQFVVDETGVFGFVEEVVYYYHGSAFRVGFQPVYRLLM